MNPLTERSRDREELLAKMREDARRHSEEVMELVNRYPHDRAIQGLAATTLAQNDLLSALSVIFGEIREIHEALFGEESPLDTHLEA